MAKEIGLFGIGLFFWKRYISFPLICFPFDDLITIKENRALTFLTLTDRLPSYIALSLSNTWARDFQNCPDRGPDFFKNFCLIYYFLLLYISASSRRQGFHFASSSSFKMLKT
ncbi:hypothetical protein DHC50_03620 [Arenibacter sp. A80]|nr:hypothetical protein [Arenibacter sp. A80]RFT58238.1 hypothetical protein D0S24_03620 [Arenibacter sp. P308M17]